MAIGQQGGILAQGAHAFAGIAAQLRRLPLRLLALNWPSPAVRLLVVAVGLALVLIDPSGSSGPGGLLPISRTPSVIALLGLSLAAAVPIDPATRIFGIAVAPVVFAADLALVGVLVNVTSRGESPFYLYFFVVLSWWVPGLGARVGMLAGWVAALIFALAVGRETTVETYLFMTLLLPVFGAVWGNRKLTVQSQSAQTVKDAEDHYQALFDGSSVSMYRTTLNGTLVDANAAFASMMGYPDTSSVLPVPPQEMYLNPSERDRWNSLMARDGVVQDFEVGLKRRDGATIWVRQTGRLVRDPSGRPLYYEGTMEDITDRRRAEAYERQRHQLEEQNRRIQEVSRTKSTFVSTVSHELRTPMNTIIGFAQLLRDGKAGPVSAEQKEFADDILSSARHALALINDVLDLAKVESGKMEFHAESIDLAPLLLKANELLSVLPARKGIDVQVKVDEAVRHVVIDPLRLQQVVYNYLSNAIKFTPEGGRVSMRVRPEGTDEFRLEVEDTGPGIPPDKVGSLFTEFEQLSLGPKKIPGTGLGLALTKRLVEAQGGYVGLESTLGRGTTFYAVLPIAPRGIQEKDPRNAPQPTGIADRADRI